MAYYNGFPVTTVQRTGEWIAYFGTTHKGAYASGETEEEAIGRLIKILNENNNSEESDRPSVKWNKSDDF